MGNGKVSEADLKIGPAFPAAKPDDVEDVSWALSTAEANWNRGDHADAIKWIRRAAEAASEAEADDRALELAKAAADLASLIVQPSAEQTPNSQHPLSQNPPLAAPGASAKRSSRPASAKHPSAAPHPRITTPRSLPPPPTSGPPSGRAPAGPRVPAPQPALPKVVPASRASERRAGRKSAHNLAEAARAARSLEVDPDVTRAVPSKRPATESRRRSKPSPEELTRGAAGENEPSPASISIAPPSAAIGEVPRTSLPSNTDEIDQWPTQSLSNEELTNLTDNRDPPARNGSGINLEKSRGPLASRMALEAIVPTSQAMRVVVWRSVDGVHVAPAGTRVSAITIDAMLVAIDPSADLAAWLSKK